MNKNTLIVFTAITLTLIITAAVVVNKDSSPTFLTKEPLLPALQQNINDAGSISLLSSRHKTLLERDGESWRIANSDDYPAQFDQVRELLINLSDLKTLERKTRNPELYHRLDVQDPEQPDSRSVRVMVSDSEGNTLADLIVGKARISRVTNIQTGLYVRRPDDEHALLVEGNVPVSAEKTAWFNPDILNITADQIQRVEIVHADDSRVDIERESPTATFVITNLPTDREVQSSLALNRFATALQETQARDVRARTSFDTDTRIAQTTISTFDGMIIKVSTFQLDDRYFARFEFDYDAALASKNDNNNDDGADLLAADSAATIKMPVSEEARDLHNRLSDWVYQIPEFQFKVLTETMDSLTRPANR
ncbi:MAG: DUF4340 domain-containing protein [Gammaproteobacteria bacterium]